MNKKRMSAMLGSLTALCMTCTTMSNAIVFAQDNTFEVINENTKETSKPDWESEASKDKTVFYNGQYYPLLTDGLKAAYMDTTTTGVKEIHCRPKADVGAMTHGHVADDLIIHGNGAYVSAGERDLEIDMYKYDRKNGNKINESESDLEKNITVIVNDLNGIAAWGYRRTTYKVTLNFNNCEYMQRVYFTGTTGENDINLSNCSFDGDGDSKGSLKGNKLTSVYSNANGKINIEKCQFNNIDVAVNLNHKVEGTQTINIKDSTFKDCGYGTITHNEKGEETLNSNSYAAPIRIVAKAGAVSDLSVDNCEFIYEDVESRNGDILLGNGQHNADLQQGIVNLAMSETKAEVMAQKAGYYNADNMNVANKDNAKTTIVQKNEVVNKQEVTANKPVEVQQAPASGSSGGGSATVKLNPVYRAYNPNNGEHLYTTDYEEFINITNNGWDAEGVAFMAEEEKNGQALYRVYNPNNGLHHYTLDEKEKNTLVSLGWHDEKVAWYTSKKPQSAPVFRVYNPNDGNHHYTMNKQEKDVLVSYGWQDEGLAFRTAPIEK